MSYFVGHVKETVEGSNSFQFTVYIGGFKPEEHVFDIDPKNENFQIMKTNVKKAKKDTLRLGVEFQGELKKVTRAEEVYVYS